MITVLFFAQTRELVGVDKLEVEAQFETAEALRHHLAEQGDKWALALKAGKLLVASTKALPHFLQVLKMAMKWHSSHL